MSGSPTSFGSSILRHFLPPGAKTVEKYRDALAALLALGCNIGCQRMALASGLSVHELSLIADYSPVLQGRGVTLYAHTSDNFLRLHQQPIPCRLREAAFSLDGLMEHDTELDPRVCYTDTHGYTEVVMATAALLGYELAPRIKDIKDQTLYKIDRQQRYPHLDPILTGTIKPRLIHNAWDETLRVIASIEERIVSPSKGERA